MFEIAFGWPRAPDAPGLARADAGRALLAILRTVTGQGGPGAAVVDRFVDRAIGANSAIRAMGGAAPWYPCR